MNELSPDLVERVLSGLGLATAPAADLKGLAALYAAWCRHVPFDNVRKMIHVRRQAPGPLPGDSAEDFFEAWLRYGTGGTCWSGNGALCTLLAALGFNVRRAVGTMLVRADLAPNHGTVIVEIDGGRHLVDASILHSEPLALHDTEVTSVEHAVWGVHCVRHDGRWHIRWRSTQMPKGLNCRIEQLSTTREEFRERHEQTRAWSPFNFELSARLIRGVSIVGVGLGQRVEFTASGRVVQRLLEGDDRKRVLVDELGINEEIVDQLPPEIPTPPPPESATARSRGR
jgi:N-hydroxyarylamine O-acetyltransferase